MKSHALRWTCNIQSGKLQRQSDYGGLMLVSDRKILLCFSISAVEYILTLSATKAQNNLNS